MLESGGGGAAGAKSSTPEVRVRAAREAHKLAAPSAPSATPRRRAWRGRSSSSWKGSARLQEADALRLSEWVVALRQLLERAAPPAAAAGAHGEDAAGERPVLALATDDAELAERVEMEASARGFAVRRSAGGASGAGVAEEDAPSAVVLDLPDAPAPDRYAGLDAFRALPDAPPVVVVSGDDGLGERVEAVRRGGRVFLRRPVSPVQVVDAVERVLLRHSAGGARLLAVDDDPQMLGLLEALLAGRGLHVHPVGDAAAFWRELGRVLPDLVVLDLDMPGLDGVDLCRALRSDPRWSTLPVLFLTGRTDPESVRALFAAGADDYVPKPVVGPELLMRIENRLERARLRSAAHDSTGPAGLPGRVRALEELARLLQLARRAGADAAVARVDLDGLGELSRRLGAEAGEEARTRAAQLLQARTAPGDVVGWWGTDTLALGFFATDPTPPSSGFSTRGRSSPASRSRRPPASCAWGSRRPGQLPDDGVDPAELVSAAELALARTRESREEGAPVLVHRVEAGGRPVEVVDVALVEDDAVVAELLLHALEVQGYSARWLQDGDEAVDRLAGRAPSLRARVVLLDVDLPVRDGLSVFASCTRPRGGASRVVMLAVRSTEREVWMALELGAADHVAKPFSVPVLMRRLRSLRSAPDGGGGRDRAPARARPARGRLRGSRALPHRARHLAARLPPLERRTARRGAEGASRRAAGGAAGGPRAAAPPPPRAPRPPRGGALAERARRDPRRPGTGGRGAGGGGARAAGAAQPAVVAAPPRRAHPADPRGSAHSRPPPAAGSAPRGVRAGRRVGGRAPGPQMSRALLEVLGGSDPFSRFAVQARCCGAAPPP